MTETPSAKPAERVVLSAELMELRTSQIQPGEVAAFGTGNARARLSFTEIELAYQKDPLVYHAVDKKARDLTKKWHRFESTDPEQSDPPPEVVERLERFARRVNLRPLTTRACAHALLYGDAYAEKTRAGDVGAPEHAPPTTGDIARLDLVLPSTMTLKRDRKGVPLSYEQQVGGTLTQIHPERIVHLRLNHGMGDDARGLGGVETAYNVIVSKIKGDKALGDILSWYGKGFLSLLIEGGSEEEVRKAWELIRKMREKGDNAFVGTERHEVEVATGAVVNPQPFLEAFYYNLAAAFDMPKDVLIGASAGAVTGSETNLRDYYEANDAMLQTFVTPFLEALYAAELGVAVEDLPVRIVWNPLYVNEQSEAKARFTEAQAASIAFRDRTITVNEYRSRLGLDPVEGGDELPKGIDYGDHFLNEGAQESPDEEAARAELKALAGDNA